MRRILGTIAVMAVCLLSACTKGSNAYFGPGEASMDEDNAVFLEYTAIVTVKQDVEGIIFFQLDDYTRLYPQYYSEPFTRECRIICGLSWWSNSDRCNLQWMDYLQEGPCSWRDGFSPDVSAGEGDGLEIVDDWMTSVEDGYLTLHYSTFWGNGTTAHTLYLMGGENPNDPYELRLVHLSNGDAALEEGDALIYFDLTGLPSTGGAGKTLTLKWKNGAGQMVSKKYLFRSRQ